jgi:hypothetical protein
MKKDQEIVFLFVTTTKQSSRHGIRQCQMSPTLPRGWTLKQNAPLKQDYEKLE